jgi:hypothetical protein
MLRNAQNPHVQHATALRVLLEKTSDVENCGIFEGIQSLRFSTLSKFQSDSSGGSAPFASTPLPITPIFVLPYKRFAANQLIQFANRYLGSDSLPLRQATSSQGKAIGYESEDHALSHTTLWRFLTCLGAMTISLSKGVNFFLEAFPESNIHRFTGSISPSKFRSESRAESLRNADRLLNLISRWDTAFPKERFFPRYATKPRAP